MARKLAHVLRTKLGGAPDSDSSDGLFVLDRRGYVRYVAAVSSMIAATTGHVAASESGVEQGNSDRDRYILIEGAEDISRYEITVDGELAPDTDAGPDAPARISGCSAEGVLADETRRYRFSGEIRDFRIDGNAELYLDDGSESLTAVE